MGDLAIWITLLACLVGCYFAACNVALKTYSKARMLDLLERTGHEDRFELFDDRTGRMVLMTGTLRACLNLVVLLGTLYVVQDRLPDERHRLLVYLLAFGVAGLLVSVFSVAIPTSWARYQPEKLLAASHQFLNGLLVLFIPLAAFLHLFDPLVRRLSGVPADAPDPHQQVSHEIMSVVQEHEEQGQVDPAQKQMLEAVFELPTISAGQIMTPRTAMQGLEVGAGLDEVKQAILREGHSRIPVYQDSLDHILGVLYAKDLIRFLGAAPADPFELRRLLRDVLMVPESKPVRELLAEFKARKVHLAIVLDEYGGTAGLITIEDVLEEIVGEIQDEYEAAEEAPELRRLDERTVEVDARLRVGEVNDRLHIAIPEDEDYDTLGGFVMTRLGHIPAVGEGFAVADLRFTVTAAERTRVNRVRIENLGLGLPQPSAGAGV